MMQPRPPPELIDGELEDHDDRILDHDDSILASTHNKNTLLRLSVTVVGITPGCQKLTWRNVRKCCRSTGIARDLGVDLISPSGVKSSVR